MSTGSQAYRPARPAGCRVGFGGEHCEPAMRRRSDSTSISRQWANQVFVARLAVAGAGLPIR